MKRLCSTKVLLFCLVVILFVLNSSLNAQLIYNEISSGHLGARSVQVVDLDSDGDLDIVGAAKDSNELLWFEQTTYPEFVAHVISSEVDSACWVYPYDLDYDDDMDLVVAATGLNQVIWFKNMGDLTFETEIICEGGGIEYLYIDDLNCDGTAEVMTCSNDADNLSIWQHQDTDEFTTIQLAQEYDGASSIISYDVDFDGDKDLISTAYYPGVLTYWEQIDDLVFERHEIDEVFIGINSAYPVDIDNDGDTDIVGVTRFGIDIGLWENEGDENYDFINISNNVVYPSHVMCCDLDLNGSAEILTTSHWSDQLCIFIRLNNEEYITYPLPETVERIYALSLADLDNDGDQDIIAAGEGQGVFCFWENNLDTSGFVKFSTSNLAVVPDENLALPVSINNMQSDQEISSIYTKIKLPICSLDVIDIEINPESEMYNANWMIEWFYDIDGIIIHAVSAEDVITQNGPLFNVLMESSDTAILNSFHEVAFENLSLNYGDEYGLGLDASLKFLNYEYGDINRDETFNNEDRLLLQEILSGDLNAVDSQKRLANVSGRNGTTAYDLALINCYLSGNIENFPVQGGVFYAQGSLEAEIDNASIGYNGDLVTIPVNLNNLSEIFSIDLKLEMDTETLEVESVTSNMTGLTCWKSTGDDVLISFAADEVLNSEDMLLNITLRQISPADEVLFSDVLYNEDGKIELNHSVNLNSSSIGRGNSVPVEHNIIESFPNPFNSTTRITINLKKASSGRVEVYNSLGQSVAVLAENSLQAGSNSFVFNGENLGSGTYYISLKLENGQVHMKKLILMK